MKRGKKLKWWDREKFVKIFATILEGLLIFLVFTLLNGLIVQEKAVPFLAFFSLSFISGIVNALEYWDIKLYRTFNLAVGIFSSLLMSVKVSENYYQLVADFIVFLFLWYRGAKIKSTMVEDVMNIKIFYRNLMWLFFLNLFAYYLPPQEIAMIQKYTILYILSTVFLLLEVKALKYHGSEGRISLFEWIGFGLLLLATFTFSLPSVAHVIYEIYTVIGKIFVLLSTYLAYGMFWILSKIFSLIPFDREFFKKAMESFYKEGKNPENFLQEETPQDYTWLSNLLHMAAFLIALTVIVLLIILIIRVISRIEVEKRERDFVEEKEIDINLKDAPFVKKFREARNRILKAAEKIKFYRDNREKVRFYYKKLLIYLYQKKALERGNYSVKDVYEKVTASFENVREPMERVSRLYEKVRYGKYYPKREEVEEFIKEIGKVMKS